MSTFAFPAADTGDVASDISSPPPLWCLSCKNRLTVADKQKTKDNYWKSCKECRDKQTANKRRWRANAASASATNMLVDYPTKKPRTNALEDTSTGDTRLTHISSAFQDDTTPSASLATSSVTIGLDRNSPPRRKITFWRYPIRLVLRLRYGELIIRGL